MVQQMLCESDRGWERLDGKVLLRHVRRVDPSPSSATMDDLWEALDEQLSECQFFSIAAGTFDGSPPATRRREGYSETLAGGQPGPARAAPPATFGTATRGNGFCGGCGSGGRPRCDASRSSTTRTVCEAAQR